VYDPGPEDEHAWAWSVGDQLVSSAPVFVWTPTEPGTAQISVVVTDLAGASSEVVSIDLDIAPEQDASGEDSSGTEPSNTNEVPERRACGCATASVGSRADQSGVPVGGLLALLAFGLVVRLRRRP
jgi:MYXO-CTERM domain-containing protein